MNIWSLSPFVFCLLMLCHTIQQTHLVRVPRPPYSLPSLQMDLLQWRFDSGFPVDSSPHSVHPLSVSLLPYLPPFPFPTRKDINDHNLMSVFSSQVPSFPSVNQTPSVVSFTIQSSQTFGSVFQTGKRHPLPLDVFPNFVLCPYCCDHKVFNGTDVTRLISLPCPRPQVSGQSTEDTIDLILVSSLGYLITR